MPYHMYVSNSGSEWLSHFIMDESSGALAAQPDIDLGGNPGAVATDAAQTWMVVALRSQKVLASYAIDKKSGGLKKIGESALAEGPPYLYSDNSDRFLLASYYGGGRVSVHGINADGTLSEKPLQELDTDIRAHSIQTDRSNRFAFVPHTNPTNAIYQFHFDQDSGRLTPNEPARIQPATEEGPRHFIFHPQKDLLYSINENGSTVSAHHFDADTGTLESFQVISTLPGGIAVEGNTTAEIDITPDGKYLYGSNRGHNSLALFEIGADGTLTAKGHFDTEAVPRFFGIDPTGRYIYSAGQDSGKLASYRIEADGALTRLGTYDVGQASLWIQFVKQA
jgi:6-phosphogluconolactonase